MAHILTDFGIGSTGSNLVETILLWHSFPKLHAVPICFIGSESKRVGQATALVPIHRKSKNYLVGKKPSWQDFKQLRWEFLNLKSVRLFLFLITDTVYLPIDVIIRFYENGGLGAGDSMFHWRIFILSFFSMTVVTLIDSISMAIREKKVDVQKGVFCSPALDNQSYVTFHKLGICSHFCLFWLWFAYSVCLGHSSTHSRCASPEHMSINSTPSHRRYFR